MPTMSPSNWLSKLLTVDDSILDEQFSLSKQGGSRNAADDDAETVPSLEPDHTQLERTAQRLPLPTHRNNVHHRKLRVDSHRHVELHDDSEMNASDAGDRISPHLDEVKAKLDGIFMLPDNKDIVVRPFTVGTRQSCRAFIVFVDGMADKNVINTHILQPLMLLSQAFEEEPIHGAMDVVMKTLVPGNQVTKTLTWTEAVPGILAGSTALFVDHCPGALIVETKGWEHRSVGLSQTEAVVRGPHDAFTESFRVNTGLVRAQLRTEHLVTEILEVGKLAKTDVAVMYIRGVTNSELVDEVRRRIKGINVDYLADSGTMEQFLEDDPHCLVPQILSTERPDRVAHALTEGNVAVFVGNSPYVLTMPVVFWSLMQTPEDAYLKVPFGSFLRTIRWLALLVALLLPALYVAVTNYHPEMLPTDLMLSIASSRELVPFPVIVEILLMEFSIELIREAGIRVPSVIGPTIGIVGALIIGQAAVQAGIVSPMLVIIIATTALASFVIPTYNLNFGVRLARFGFLAVSAIFGFYGIALASSALIVNLTVQRSFGVPLLSPIAPSMKSSPDVLFRGASYAMNERPEYLKTQHSWRQQPYTRPWSPVTRSKGRPWGRKRGKP